VIRGIAGLRENPHSAGIFMHISHRNNSLKK